MTKKKEKAKNPSKKLWGLPVWGWIIIAIILIGGIGSSVNSDSSSEVSEVAELQSEETTKASEDEETVQSDIQIETAEAEEAVVEEVKGAEYDDLQNLFVRITPDSLPEDILSMISEYGLSYTEKTYSKAYTIKIVYTDGAALQKYADSGDSLEVNFDKRGTQFQYADYSAEGHTGTSLLYYGGNFYEMYNVDESYYGYYYVNSMDSKKRGVKIHDHDSYFYRVDDAYSAIDRQLNN